MILFPAIDILDGKVVRLFQGRFDEVTQYSKDPVAMAHHWKKEGAQWLHIVDLDGAKTGDMKNIEIIKKIAQDVQISIQVGGGVRSVEKIKELIDVGIKRVVLGTKVVENKNFLEKALSEGVEGVVVSVDCSNGFVVRRGWTTNAAVRGVDLAKELQNKGLKTIIYTDTARDGTLTGPDFDGLREILDSVNISVIASGGISNIEDVKKLNNISKEYKGRLTGAITGKAIYEGKLDFKEAVDLLK